VGTEQLFIREPSSFIRQSPNARAISSARGIGMMFFKPLIPSFANRLSARLWKTTRLKSTARSFATSECGYGSSASDVILNA